LACWSATGPIVGTFHVAMALSRTMAAANAALEPALEKLSARIAVSEPARRTLVEHLGGDAILIPNGVSVARFMTALPLPALSLPNLPGRGCTVGFLGRFDEPRKGFDVLVAALTRLLASHPELRLLVAGPGDRMQAMATMPPNLGTRTTMLGEVSEIDKARLLRSVDVFVAPNTGGESFGIVLTEAMAAGVAVVASDLDGFRRVLGDSSCARLVPPGEPQALAGAIGALLDDPPARAALAAAAAERVRRFDWARIVGDVVGVYDMVVTGAAGVEDFRTARFARLVGLSRN
jgi:phosphatidylinositol alpha-mannosyltransferase